MKETDLQSFRVENRRKGFLRVPHFLLDDLYSDQPMRRGKAWVYLCFLKHVYFADGEIVVDHRRMPCHKGEWITTFRQLAQKTDIPRTTLGCVLKLLEEDWDLEIRHEGRFTFVRLIRLEIQEEEPAFSPKGTFSIEGRESVKMQDESFLLLINERKSKIFLLNPLCI